MLFCGPAFALLFFVMACHTPPHGDKRVVPPPAHANGSPEKNRSVVPASPTQAPFVAGTQPSSSTPIVSAETRVYLRLLDLSIHSDIPSGFYVVGTQNTDGFYPNGIQIEGNGQFGSVEGTPGWLELLDQRFYPAMTSRAPARPYIDGTKNDRGFIPSSRRIYY